MKILGVLLLAAAVSARPDYSSQRLNDDSKEVQQQESASLPSQTFIYLPDYGVGVRRPLVRPRFPPAYYLQQQHLQQLQQLQQQRPFRPRPLQQQYADLPLLLPLPLSLLQAKAYQDMDISDWVERLEESVQAEEPSVFLASSDSKKTSLILKPVAKAVAGPKGVAVASPIANAVLRRGQPATIDYQPDAVAIAGPGGSAESHPKLMISYAEEPQEGTAGTSAATEATDVSQPTPAESNK